MNNKLLETLIHDIIPGGKFFSERIRSILRHAETIKGHPHGDREIGKLEIQTVAKNFPLKGSLILRREDGKVANVQILKGKWVCGVYPQTPAA